MKDSPSPVRREAPAKVNLSLRVIARRPDRYHDIESWIVKLRWFDSLTVRPSDRFHLALSGDAAGVPADDTNLVHRAAETLARAAGRACRADVELQKTIPHGAGLGGGSSDAAATLLALNDLWGLDWPVDRLHPIAREIGADVPLFLHGPELIVRGIGDRIEDGPRNWHGWLVVAIPPFSVSTAAVYERWVPPGPAGAVPHDDIPWSRAALSAMELAERLFNDLEAPAFALEPRLAAIHRALGSVDGRMVRMTGSGSAFYALFDGPAEAQSWQKTAQSATREFGLRFEVAQSA